jgi:hypothetical protein
MGGQTIMKGRGMPTRLLVIGLLALAGCAPAAAQTLNGVLPPVEYDHSFAGELTVVTAKDQAEVRTLCPNSKFPPIGALGCAHIHPDGKQCRVILAPDADIVAAGYSTEVVKRHEIGHCNGWSATHEGSRVVEEWATLKNRPHAPNAGRGRLQSEPLDLAAAMLAMAKRLRDQAAASDQTPEQVRGY